MKKAIICLLIPVLLIVLSGCSFIYSEAPDVVKMESVFSEHKADFQSITNYLTETYPVTPDLYSVYIEGNKITVFRTQTGTYQLDRKDIAVADTPISDAYNNLKKAGCQSISMAPQINGKGQENAIYFRMWLRTIDEADGGIAYAVDNSYPPQIEFQTALEALSEDGWYYCLAEYNKWRITKPTFVSTYDER